VSNKQLLDDFFKSNTVDSETPSAQALTNFHIKIGRNPDARDNIQNLVNEFTEKHKPERKEKSLLSLRKIETATTYEQLIRIMRKGVDLMNCNLLINKVLEYEDEIVPDITKRLKTSMNDNFTELSVRILARSNINVTDEVVGYYEDMRCPYSQSLVLVLLGFIADESYIPWLIEKYDELKALYPNESYCDGAYYALYEIENRLSSQR